ncbi:hypothetical protein [Ralstonia solanacearum]|uniref:Uncharacterized protein n=1 Tax=Ralstonia solanacearum TaxID=305 RepID=A0A7X0UJR9_RALSL|nr:hypothetical protein [Ralstonia solanacearum]MBB6581867.1 hypothetical protein [Ralstonia solanacearum]MBB6584764.1 hypothetical protein [Ralstonia solanacearum]MDB0524499.1 hypothetical protein [Ralstonia solanacearum]
MTLICIFLIDSRPWPLILSEASGPVDYQQGQASPFLSKKHDLQISIMKFTGFNFEIIMSRINLDSAVMNPEASCAAPAHQCADIHGSSAGHTGDRQIS